MGALRNARHEVFAQGIAKGLSQTEAYIRCGYGEKGARQNASRLMTNEQIAGRIAELQAAGAKRVTIDQEYPCGVGRLVFMSVCEIAA